jgi:DNA-binding MarR family transcriptional regulator
MSVFDRTRATRLASTGWLVQRAAARFEARMAEALRPQGLTIAQFAVLMRVLERPDQSQVELGAAFAMPAWAISRALDGLAAEGLVIRAPCPLSRRTQRIRPTEAALARAGELQALVQAVNAGELAPLAPDEQAALHGLLSKLVWPD